MKVTVKDCLKLEAFSPCAVVAGRRNLSNRVRSVSVMDAVTPEEAIAKNGIKTELVMTSLTGVKDDRTKIEIIRSLANAGIAALVVFPPARGEPQVNHELTEAAEKAGLPMIVFTSDNKTHYSDVISQVMDKLFYGDHFKNNLINNSIYHLLDFERHSSFQSALREAAVNNEFQVVILSKDFNPILTVETLKRMTVADAVRMGRERDMEVTDDIYTFIDVNGVLTYWGPLAINDEKYFMFIVDNEDNYSKGEITKLAEIIELAIGMWKYTPERDANAELIKALIRNNKSLAYSLKDEMGINAASIISVFYAKGIDTPHGKELLDCFEIEQGMTVIRIADNDETYGIIMRNRDTDESPNYKLVCLNLYDTLKELDKSVRIFQITGLNGIEGAADGFRLITETWNFVETVFPYKRVFTKYELTLASNCVNLQIQGGYLKKNYMDLLEPFDKEIGENKGRQLLETLETFVLDAGMNSGKTSSFLGIHTNTVQYRLKRINEILGVEITGNRVIPGLTMALALKRLERVVK